MIQQRQDEAAKQTAKMLNNAAIIYESDSSSEEDFLEQTYTSMVFFDGQKVSDNFERTAVPIRTAMKKWTTWTVTAPILWSRVSIAFEIGVDDVIREAQPLIARTLWSASLIS